MMNQEHHVEVHALKNESWTNIEIAEELGYHPATVAKWLKADGPPERAAVDRERPVMTALWRARIGGPLVEAGGVLYETC